MAAARKTTSTTSTDKADDTSTAKAEDTKSDATSTTKAEDTKATTSTTKADDTKSDATGADTNDKGQLPQSLSATDPVVTEDHQQASRAAKAKIKDVKRAARVQVSQFDTSTFARSPLDALAKPEKDSDKK